MAKRATPTKRKSDDKDKVKAIVVASLKRAIAAVEGSMVDKSTRPAEGCYPVDLTVGINGDITVGKEKPAGAPRKVPDITDSEILAGILATRRNGDDGDKLLAEGMAGVKLARQHDGTKAMLADLAERADRQARRLRLTKTVQSSGAAGAVSGKPTVLVRGSQDLGIVQVEVEAA